MKMAQFTHGLTTHYHQLFQALSNRLDAVEKETFGPNYNQLPSTPPLNSRVRASELQFITRAVQGDYIRCALTAEPSDSADADKRTTWPWLAGNARPRTVSPHSGFSKPENTFGRTP